MNLAILHLGGTRRSGDRGDFPGFQRSCWNCGEHVLSGIGLAEVPRCGSVVVSTSRSRSATDSVCFLILGSTMLLTISTDAAGADDLSHLLHKHPGRLQSFDVSVGQAHVFYPEATAERTTACLMLEVDAVRLAKKNRGRNGLLAGYVNDRPWATSSFMSTAIASVFGSAMAGRCKDRPEAAERPMDLAITLTALPVRGGTELLRRLFEPLGYDVDASECLLDDRFPEWGNSPYLTVELNAQKRLSEVLNHLYVLIPVFDNQKHYFIGQEEMEKLLSKGQGWLADHPCKETIARRYLRHQRGMVRRALESLRRVEDDIDEEDFDEASDAAEVRVEQQNVTPPQEVPKIDGAENAGDQGGRSLNDQRHQAVIDEVIRAHATSVVDLGCGEGKLLRKLAKQRQLTSIIGMDVSVRALEVAARRLRIDSQPGSHTKRVGLIHGSLAYRDRRLSGFDVACLVEVIEHMDPFRLASLQRVVFDDARPATVVVTTPNVEYNRMWASLPAGQFRHRDHRFEWTRDEFQSWAGQVAVQYGYQVRFEGIGPVADEVGSPTQMAVFTLLDQP